MKDLDKTQVYDLRGITKEQVKELYEWLSDNDDGWYGYGHYRIMGYRSLEYSYTEWMVSNRKPTTHISTLFEQSYEQQLKEAKKKLDHYKREVERLENESKPKIGDVCKFWNDFEESYVIGVLHRIGIVRGYYPIWGSELSRISFRNARKLTEQEVIDLLFKKS